MNELDDSQHLTVLTAADDQRITDLLERDEFFWLDLVSPDAETISALGHRFGWHELAIEDMHHFGQRPKLDEWGDYAVLVFYGSTPVAADEHAQLVEVHVVVHGGYVVTVRRRSCGVLDSLHDTLERAPLAPEHAVVYRILDALGDTFFPVLTQLADGLDDLEESIVTGPDPEQLQLLLHLKRQVVVLGKVAAPQRDLLARTIDQLNDLPGFQAGAHDYFRDLYDHMLRVGDQIDTLRDLLTSAMDVYLSVVANQQNEVMRRLTLLSTVFMPLTFLTGFFGMNFAWMVHEIASPEAFWALGVGGSIVAIAVFLVLFKRSGWS